MPAEILLRILIETVVAEIKNRGLCKESLHDAAHESIARLRMVCTIWDDIMMATCFVTGINRFIDDLRKFLQLT